MAIHNPIKGFMVVVVAKLFHYTTDFVETSYCYSGIAFIGTLIVTVIGVMCINHLPSKLRKFF